MLARRERRVSVICPNRPKPTLADNSRSASALAVVRTGVHRPTSIAVGFSERRARASCRAGRDLNSRQRCSSHKCPLLRPPLGAAAAPSERTGRSLRRPRQAQNPSPNCGSPPNPIPRTPLPFPRRSRVLSRRHRRNETPSTRTPHPSTIDILVLSMQSKIRVVRSTQAPGWLFGARRNQAPKQLERMRADNQPAETKKQTRADHVSPL
jgi:hypothetical protein